MTRFGERKARQPLTKSADKLRRMLIVNPGTSPHIRGADPLTPAIWRKITQAKSLRKT